MMRHGLPQAGLPRRRGAAGVQRVAGRAGRNGFLDQLEACLDEFGVDPARLELEVTETAAATPQSESILREVQALGVRIAIDDFGVGYSSLARLQRMPVTCSRSTGCSLPSSAPRSDDRGRSPEPS